MMYSTTFVRALKRYTKAALRPMARRYRSRAGELPPSYWGLTHEPGHGLALNGLSLHRLLERWGSPLHVLDGATLARNIEQFSRPRPASGLRCEVFYSYKTNPVPGMLRFMHDRGVGAEVISPYEFWLACQLGVPPGKIVYNGPAKTDAALREAVEREVLLINVNHREELGRLARIADEVGKRPAVGLRVVGASTWGGQFGVRIATGEAFSAYAEALSAGVLDVAAIHAHSGVQIRSAAHLGAFVRSILAFCDELHERLGLELRILDFGGSLAIRSVAPLSRIGRRLNAAFHRPLTPPAATSALTIEDYVQRLLEAVEGHYGARGRPVPRVFVEPGRAMSGDAQMLVARVITTRESADGEVFAILDAGINLAKGTRNEYHQLFPVNRFGQPRTRVYTLAGPICSPADVLYPAWELPVLSAGDSVVIMDAGAYFVPYSTSFSFPRPAIVMIDGGCDRVLRLAETFDDLIARDVAGFRADSRGVAR